MAGWSLRGRLLVVVMALLTAVCAVVCVVSALVLRAWLLDRVDAQLEAASDRSVSAPPADGPPGRGPELPEDLAFLDARGTAAGTLGARLVGGDVAAAGVLDDSGDVQGLTAAGKNALTTVPTDGEPHTVAVEGLGDYRVVADEPSNGDVLLTGLPLDSMQATLYRFVAVEAGVATAGIAAAAFAGRAIIRLTLRPLRRVAATASRVSELPLDRGEVALAERVPDIDTDPHTEVGQVGAALNRMLGHVGNALTARHESELQVRQFVADASHELRTPLAAIRGYAEFTHRSRQNAPPDIVRAMGRVESEAERMTALVEDLLLLARLDAGRPLDRQPVDLSLLIVDAVSDARVTGPDHTWLLDLPDDPVVVPGDPARLHQVVANLLANARTHTPSGSTVVMGLHREGDEIGLVVTDDGPGIPAAVRPLLFQRFGRGDTSRSRAAGSTGLGLAIVAAVIAAHHGRIDVASRPGETSFTVTLPVRSVPVGAEIHR